MMLYKNGNPTFSRSGGFSLWLVEVFLPAWLSSPTRTRSCFAIMDGSGSSVGKIQSLRPDKP